MSVVSKLPYLNLKDDTYKITVTPTYIPYTASVKYVEGGGVTYISSLDGAGDIVVTRSYPELPTVGGVPIFTADKQLVEVTPQVLPTTGVEVTEESWSLSGEQPAISFINIDGYVLDYEAFKSDRLDITEGTPYNVEYLDNHLFKDYLYIPPVSTDGFTSTYEPISITTIKIR